MTHESRLTRELRALLQAQRVAALGTLSAESLPFVSMVPYAIEPVHGCLVIHVSALAAHTGYLQARPAVSLLVMQSEVPGQPVHALPRVTLAGQASVLAPGGAPWALARAAYLARFPEAEPMTELGDFSFVAITPAGARQIAGFGAARSIDENEVRQALAFAKSRKKSSRYSAFVSVRPVPPSAIRAYAGRRAAVPDLLLIELQRGCRDNVKGDPKRMSDIGVLDGKLPGQEYLAAVPTVGKISRIKAAAAARNDAVRLARIKNHHRAPDQRDSMACRGEMQVQSPILAQEKIAKGRRAIVRAVVVVFRATAGHQGYVAGGQHLAQAERACPVGGGLYAAPVIRPAHTRPRQRQLIDITGFKAQVQRYVFFPIGCQPDWERGHIHRA